MFPFSCLIIGIIYFLPERFPYVASLILGLAIFHLLCQFILGYSLFYHPNFHPYSEIIEILDFPAFQSVHS